MENPDSKFLHDRNPNLHTSQEVEGVVDYLRTNGEQIPNEPAHKIEHYLGFLANTDYVNDGILTGNQESIERQIEAHVIKDEDVPERYFGLQRRIAREQGHGNIRITDTMREQLVEAVQSDQHSALSKWVEYLGGGDGSYPNWFKYYTWNSVTKLGNYDKEKGEFLKRSKGTTAPYPELNREALAYVFDAVHKNLKGESVDAANDEQLHKLLQSANFGKLYSHAVLKLQPATPEQKQNIEGCWTKYGRSDDPRTARRLAGSLQGHGTGWCTAGESTAGIQLRNGDFYVYYTKDEDGKNSIPRVAIRMQSGRVAEVRGINGSQELEPVMTDIALERLKDLPGGEEYTQKAEDMQRLTALEKKLTENPGAELAQDEIAFLYELERPIQGFGYEIDPRVGELASKRGIVKDMAILLGTDPEDIQATVRAMVEVEKEYEYPNLNIGRVIGQCTGLSLELAQQLLDLGKSNLVRKHLNSFTSLSDEIAQQFIEDIRGIDVASFKGLSEDTFFRLVDEFGRFDRHRNGIEDRETYVWRLLEKAAAGHFDLPDHQRVVNQLMDKELWHEAGLSPKYFKDLDTAAIANRLIAEGQLHELAPKIENFPTVNHQEFAELLAKEDPGRLGTILSRLNVDRNVYARKVIEAGKISYLPVALEGYDQDVLDALEAHRVAMEERDKAERKRQEEWRTKQAEHERSEQERLADWDDTQGDPLV